MGGFLENLTGTGNSFYAPGSYAPGATQNAQTQTNQVINGETDLQKQLGQQALGNGPNPAQMQYKQNVNQAIQNAAGLNAANRGISPALAANLSSEESSQMLGQAAGNAATLQAQQQLGAQQAQAGLYNQMGNQTLNQQQIISNANNAANSINAGVAQQNTSTAGQIVGGIANAAGGAGEKLAGLAYGGSVMPPHLEAVHQIYHGGSYSGGGNVNAMVSPGEVYLPPQKAAAVAEGKASAVQVGDKIPGKAKMKGDHKENDTVPAKLETGGLVIPKSVMESDNPAKEANKFVADHLKSKKKSPENDFKQALSRAAQSRGKK